MYRLNTGAHNWQKHCTSDKGVYEKKSLCKRYVGFLTMSTK